MMSPLKHERPGNLAAILIFAFCFLIAGCASQKQACCMRATPKIEAFEKFPAQCDPRGIGEKIAHNFLKRDIYTINGKIVYPEVCTAFGALRFAGEVNDRDLENHLVDRYKFLLTPGGAQMIATNRHVDFHVFGALPLEIYLLNGDTNWLALGLEKADDQWINPLPSGLARESRWWVDDCFMIGILQIQAYRATQDPKYADHAAYELADYLDKLQQPNGLFYHATTSPHFWGRGNGWFAVALAEVLSSLPPDHPKYQRLMNGYKKMMAALKKYQAPSGCWRQLVDNDRAWDETSCTGMFTFALITGVQHGWLDQKEYAPVARRGWIGLCRHIDQNGDVHDVCVGTNEKDDTQYYLDRPRKTGDLHGEAPALWCAWALLQ
ncbi:MAG TPA: glycoside hydrolase family 88 protein [Verrucomicrobiae bacterium]|nr:glycoside hydrolase family 88 protein [Verrucomicrobiae bacterium]